MLREWRRESEWVSGPFFGTIPVVAWNRRLLATGYQSPLFLRLTEQSSLLIHSRIVASNWGTGKGKLNQLAALRRRFSAPLCALGGRRPFSRGSRISRSRNLYFCINANSVKNYVSREGAEIAEGSCPRRPLSFACSARNKSALLLLWWQGLPSNSRKLQNFM